MSNRKVLVTETHLEDIADAIRGKNGRIDTYTPGEMADAIEAIPTSATLIQKTVTQNGVYDPQDDDADGYSLLSVNVSGGGGGADLEGNLAPAYEDLDDGYVIKQGQHCIYEGQYYIANQDIEEYEDPFVPAHWDATTVDDDVLDLYDYVDSGCIEGDTTTLTVGTTTVTGVTGITTAHVVAVWQFSSGNANNPPADISIMTGTNSYTITVSRVYVAGATVTPVFIRMGGDYTL